MPFTLQSTAALFALLALLVPLIIHLLSKSRGTLVPFAHIALIKKIKQQPMRQIRLIQRILLFLRWMVLLLAALLLAGLMYLRPPEQVEKQVLITPHWLAYAGNDEKLQLVRSLPAKGATLLTVPAQKLSAEQILTWPVAENIKTQNDNIWAKVKARLSDIPADTEVEVYTTNSASQFTGEKVSLHHKVTWHIKNLPPEPLGTVQSQVNIAVIYDADRSEDVTYIQAALAALQKSASTGLSIEVLALSAPGNGSQLAATDAIVYLSSAELPGPILALIGLGRTLLIDAAQVQSKGAWSATTSGELAIAISGTMLGSPAQLSLPELANGSQQSPARIRWQTDKKQVLLTEQGFGQGRIIGFHSRFNPAWNNLVLQLPFPLLLTDQLLVQKRETLRLQQARLSDGQIKTYETVQASLTSPWQVSLEPLLAVLLVVFFAAERLLSEWRRPAPVEGQ